MSTETRIEKITKAYTRHYRDNSQTTAYVEWLGSDGRPGRTEGEPGGTHMAALFARAKREGIIATQETW